MHLPAITWKVDNVTNELVGLYKYTREQYAIRHTSKHQKDKLTKELAASRAEKEKRKSTNSRTFNTEKHNF